jgi:hypothetical protein
MARTAGIISSAVVVFIGSAVAMLLGALVASIAISKYPNWTSPAGGVGGVFGYYVMAASIIVIGLGGWGIASGVGILNARPWARTSMLVFGAILLVVVIPAALEMVVDPHVGIVSPYLESPYRVNMRAEMMAFYGLLAMLGGFWLYFFNKKSVKAQFSG